jgi:cytidylate kinase
MWSIINIPFFVSRGYVVFVPDIVYKGGIPGESAYNCVVSGAQSLWQFPWIDRDNMAIQGQSWGGYQVAYLITRTGMFWRMISPAAYVDQPYYIRSIEQHIILEFAMKGPCVILGRCADDTLEKAGIPSLNVFLYASDIHRAVRVGELIGSKNPTEIQKKMQKTDAARRNYYEQFTGKKWGDSHNYSLCLDTGLLGHETCVQLICEAARRAEAFQ